MGCKACDKLLHDENQINFSNQNNLNKPQLDELLNKFLENSGYEKIYEEEFISNIPEDYIKYCNDHEFILPQELKEKENLIEMNPIKFKNGNIYKGKWNAENQMEGLGKYLIKDDNVYTEGFWENGELKYGRIFLPDGIIYEGYINDSKYNGNGKLIFPDATYEGLFSKGEFKKGKMLWNNGYEYEGEFNGNCLQGKGKLTGPDNEIYEGEFNNNLFHGKGKYIYKNNECEYDGEFQYGIKKGKGKYTANYEYTYDGNWDNDLPFGNGKYSTCDNTCVLKCTFRAGKIAEEPIYEVGSKENINVEELEIKPKEMKLNTKNLTHLNFMQGEKTQFVLGSVLSFLNE
jgi:hypothetical protein